MITAEIVVLGGIAAGITAAITARRHQGRQQGIPKFKVERDGRDAFGERIGPRPQKRAGRKVRLE